MPGNGAAAGASYGDLLVTSLLVLGAVCVAAFVAVRVFGRLLAAGRARGAHLLDVVARVPLEPRRSLYVVEVAGKTLLVGTSEMGLSVLSELDGGEVRSRVQSRQSFGELVRAAWLRRKGRAATDASRAHVGTRDDVDARAPRGANELAKLHAQGSTDEVANPRAHVGTNDIAGANEVANTHPTRHANEGANMLASARAHVGRDEVANLRAPGGADEVAKPRAPGGADERANTRAHVGTDDVAKPHAAVGTGMAVEQRLPRDVGDA